MLEGKGHESVVILWHVSDFAIDSGGANKADRYVNVMAIEQSNRHGCAFDSDRKICGDRTQ
jgi:hypothetical protein